MPNYRLAPEVEELARELIAEHHPHLKKAQLVYTFVSETPNSNGVQAYGRTTLMTGRASWLASPALQSNEQFQAGQPFFLIEIAWPIWDAADNDVRSAMVDHELCHCSVMYDTDDLGRPTEKYSKVGHDVEEFRGVVNRHGIDWDVTLRRFIDAAKDPQVRLPFNGEGEDLEVSVTMAGTGRTASAKVKDLNAVTERLR